MTLLLVEWLTGWFTDWLNVCVCASGTHTFALASWHRHRHFAWWTWFKLKHSCVYVYAIAFIKWKYLCIIKQIANRDNVWLLSTGETNDDSLCTAICRRLPLHIHMQTHTNTHTPNRSNMFCQQQHPTSMELGMEMKMEIYTEICTCSHGFVYCIDISLFLFVCFVSFVMLVCIDWLVGSNKQTNETG